ncbi:hypothetical protein K9N68_15005 [Kovacikia minuta CCNUW1]|uniref:Pepco domain-containing protein n=1 Tax=Kovacikia minuta TaxID=2931930 RepID=UPI001CCFDBFF|nr:hypothetical protein [Kovacikia minuta]UBF29026.1 hypothetical protein K9N68_15005 [Kovacikia minuta CCNUW1]
MTPLSRPFPEMGKETGAMKCVPRTVAAKGVRLNVVELQQRMTDFLHMVGQIFQQAEQQAVNLSAPHSKLLLDEIELAVEISAEGEVKLIASAKAAGKGAITLKFKRVEAR